MKFFQSSSWAVGAFCGLTASAPAWAVIYSPTTAELFDVIDVTTPFGGNGSLFDKTLNLDNVEYDLDFAPGADTISRVVLENENFTTDLTAFDGFDILFEPLSFGQDINVSTFIRTGESGFFAAPTQLASVNSVSRISLDLSSVPDLDDVRGFGIQMFEPSGSTAPAVLARVSTAPQPPVFTETSLFSYETPDNGATPVNEQLERWTTGFEAGHTHAIGTLGATDGTSALRVTRTKAPSDPTFVWGSQVRLSTDPGNANEVFDPTAQPVIDQIATALAGTNATIAFDVTIDPADVDTSNLGPGDNAFLGFGMAINTGTFYQTNQQFINGETLTGTELIEFTFEAPISSFGALADNLPATDGTQSFLAFHISSNTNVSSTFSFDNFRILAEATGFIDGDYNGDGFVSQADLDLVLLNWGDAVVPAEWLATDQFDGVQVSQNELDGVLLNWGSGTPPAGVSAIPEPATLGLLALGGLALSGRQRRRH